MSYTSSYWDRLADLDAEPQHALAPEYGDPGPSHNLTRNTFSKLRREAGQLNDEPWESTSRGTPPPRNAPERPPLPNDAQASWWAPHPPSEWSRDGEFQRLRDEMLEAARFRPEARSLFHTHGGSAFSSRRDNSRSAAAAPDDPSHPAANVQVDAGGPPALPSELFPPHRAVDGAAELAGFIAASSYIVSLGGPPVPDLRYGIIIVPAGDESLLFKGYGDHAAMPAGFNQEVHARSKEVRKDLRVALARKLAKEGFGRFATEVEEELDEAERDFYRQRLLSRGGNEGVSAPIGDRGDDDGGYARSISTEKIIRRQREEIERRWRERREPLGWEGSQDDHRVGEVEQDGLEPQLYSAAV